MMKELHLSIVSPEKSVFDGEVKIVTLPGTVGLFSILPGHAPPSRFPGTALPSRAAPREAFLQFFHALFHEGLD